MPALTCSDVQSQLELLAADECDAPAGAEIEAHLAMCSRCAAEAEEARILVGLLTLRHREQTSLQQIRARVQRPAPPRVRFTGFAQRLGAVAAMLLCVLGIWSLLDGLRPGSESASDGKFAQAPQDFRNGRHAPAQMERTAISKLAAPGPLRERYGFTLLVGERTPRDFFQSQPCVAGQWVFEKETDAHWIGSLARPTGNVPPVFPADKEPIDKVGPLKVKRASDLPITLTTWKGQIILRQADARVRLGTPQSLKAPFCLVGYETTPGGGERDLFKHRPELTYRGK